MKRASTRSSTIRRDNGASRSRRRFHAFPTCRIGRVIAMIFLGTIGVLAVATSAGAYLTYHGGGAGALDLATLQPPTGVSAVFPNPDVRTVDVSWSAPTEPSGITIAGYYVQSYVGVTPRPACGTSPTSLITTLTCDDTNVPSNTFTYTVTAVFRSWSATSAPSSPVTVPAPLLSSFTLAPSTPTPLAGTSFTVAITAVDQYGEIDTLYSGAECLTFSGAATSPGGFAPSYPDPGACSSGSAVTFVNGVASGANSPQITLFDAQSLTLTATDNPTSVDGTTSLSVLSSQATTFAVANPGTQTVGVAFNDTITALDAYGNTATAYTGAQSLNFSGPSNSPNTSVPTYPSSVTFNAGVGDATGIVLVDAETTTLTATQGALTGTSTSFLVVCGTGDGLHRRQPRTSNGRRTLHRYDQRPRLLRECRDELRRPTNAGLLGAVKQPGRDDSDVPNVGHVQRRRG